VHYKWGYVNIIKKSNSNTYWKGNNNHTSIKKKSGETFCGVFKKMQGLQKNEIIFPAPPLIQTNGKGSNGSGSVWVCGNAFACSEEEVSLSKKH